MFGLHDNASITRAQSDTAQLLKSILLTESSGGGSAGADKEATILAATADILSKVDARSFFLRLQPDASYYEQLKVGSPPYSCRCYVILMMLLAIKPMYFEPFTIYLSCV